MSCISFTLRNPSFSNSSVTVMITATPGSFPPHMVQHIDHGQLVTVKGFNKIKIYTIVNCMHSAFSGDMERIRYLMTQLEDNMLIDSMCRMPLNLILISNNYL